MKKFAKVIIPLMLAVITAAGAQTIALAAEDIVDEAEVYMEEQVFSNITVSQTSLEGTVNRNIENSPALGDTTIPITVDTDMADDDMDEEAPETTTGNTQNPSTGAPSLLLPIGTAMMALGCIPMIMKKK